MRKWLPAIFCLLLPVLALAQSQPSPPFVNAPNTGPGNPLTAGELNAAFAQKQDAITFGSGVLAALANAANAAGGICTNGGGGCAGGSSAFSALTGGTNTSAAMLVGAGASLSYTSTGVINANQIGGIPITLGTLTNSDFCTITTGTPNVLNCNSAGGAAAFSGLTSGTNSTAAMVVGTGASLGTSGSGTISANNVDGSTIILSAGNIASAGAVIAGTTQTITAAQWAAGDIFDVTAAAQTLTLPLSTTLANNGTLAIHTIGQSVTFTPNASDAINGGTAGASITIPAGLFAVVTKGATANTINVSPTVAGGGSGTVNSGTAGQLGYYAGTGTAISGTNAGTGVLTALGNATNAANGFCVISSSNACNYRSASIGWIAGVNPNNAGVIVLPANSTLVSIVGNVETATGSAATVTVNVAASGTACSAGTAVHSGSFNANGTAATNQTLTLTTTAITSGQRLCLQTTGTTAWTGGSGVGTLTVAYTTP